MNRRQFLQSTTLSLGGLFVAERLLAIDKSFAPPPASMPLNAMGQMGFLDVTQAPYQADPTGKIDCTKAIQQAVNDARDHQLVCFFPSGTYLISAMISCEQKANKVPNASKDNEYRSDRWHPCILMGSTKGARPVIRLAPGAQGFGDYTKPKPAIWIWAQTGRIAKGQSEPKWGQEQPNISFNNIFRGIDIDIRGNAGACGIRHTGSQGSSLEEVTILAEGAYAGMDNCPGQGGGTYDVTVIGGRYGITIDKDCRFPTLTGCQFKDQTASAVRQTGGTIPVLLVGCSIEQTNGPALDLTTASPQGALSLIDSMISIGSGTLCGTKTAMPSLFLENTFVKGASHVVANGATLPVAEGWTEIRRFASCGESATNCIDGAMSSEEIADWSAAAEAPSLDAIRQRHLWGKLPSFEDSDAVNVKALGAIGDGKTDDTAALKRAIAAHEKVFLPKGVYLVSESLVLGPRTQLFGAARVVTEIRATDGFGEKNQPLITTVDDAQATTCLSNISLGQYVSDPNVTAIEWKAGRQSTLHSIWVYLCDSTSKVRPVRAHSTYHVTGNGGGRWYAVNAYEGQLATTTDHTDYRRLLVEGTTEPLAIYAFNVERVRATPQSEIRNANHVRIYYYKSEAGTFGGDHNTPLRIVDSSDVAVHCVSGVIALEDGSPVVEVVNSPDVEVTQVKSFRSGGFLTLKETLGADSVTVPGNTRVVLYRRNKGK